MTRTALALLAAFALAACDQSTSAEPIPSGTDAPRLTVTVLTGTKVAPVDTPTVKVEWSYADSGLISVNDSAFSFHNSGSRINKISCIDSTKIHVFAIGQDGTKFSGITKDSSKTVYCK